MAKLHTLRDNFNDNSIDTGVWAADPGVAETGGQVVITPSTAFPAIETIVAYDMVESSVFIKPAEVTANGTTGSLDCGMIVQVWAGSNRAGIHKLGSNIVCSKIIGGVNTDVYSTPYSATGHAYWRMRESGGIFYWEVSPTGRTWTQLFSTTVSSGLFAVNSVKFFMYAGYSVAESAPGTFKVESVNPILLQNTAGFIAGSFTSQSVTNNTASTLTFTGSGSTTTTGTAAATIIAASGGSGVRNLAGLLAASFTSEPVTNTTTSVTSNISASSLTTTAGRASFNRILVISATGVSGWAVRYDDPLTYDDPTLYDLSFTSGSANLAVTTTPGVQLFTASGLSTTSGSVVAFTTGASDITAVGATLTSGDVTLEIPTVFITATSVTPLTGTARLRTDHLIFASGAITTTGEAFFTLISPLWIFEPPVVYDNPPFLPDTRGWALIHARRRNAQPRGRTVLKNRNKYSIVDTPTVDQVNNADVVYQGGHIYTIEKEEAMALMAAGFTVTGVGVSPSRPPTSSFPGVDVFPSDSLFPAT